MERIFISYKRANKKEVFRIVKYIEEKLCVKCWVDLDGIESSAQFASVICNAIDSADVVLFMHSAIHLKIDFESDWTIKELNYAQAKKKRVVLVKLDASPLDNIFLLNYGSKNNIDSQDQFQMQKLVKDLTTWLNLPPYQSLSIQNNDGNNNAFALKEITGNHQREDSTIKCLRTFNTQLEFLFVNFSLDGQFIISKSADNVERLWDVNTGKCLRTLSSTKMDNYIYSPNGRYYIDRNGMGKKFCIYDTCEKKYVDYIFREFKGHEGWIESACFNPNSDLIVTASRDKTVRIWDVHSRSCLHVMEGHSHWVRSASFSPNGAYIVSASQDKTIRIWDVYTGLCLHILRGHTDWINYASFSQDGKYIVSASDDKSIKIWGVVQ